MARGMAGQARGLSALQLKRDGAELVHRLSPDKLAELEAFFATVPAGAGHRLSEAARFASIVEPLHELVQGLIGPKARAVRAIAFDKTGDVEARRNWSLGWHQDRTICVQDHHEMPGYERWTRKHGITHVEPPFCVIETMLTARFHLDRVDHSNAPLKIAAGSHQHGLIAESEIDALVERSSIYACLAERSDVWLYATPILHASEASLSSASRRVLQVDFHGSDLPAPLAWLFDRPAA